jgi:hypothetical protein
MVKKIRGKENIELAKEHVRLAEDLVDDEAKTAESEDRLKKFTKTEFALEKAESEIEDLEN